MHVEGGLFTRRGIIASALLLPAAARAQPAESPTLTLEARGGLLRLLPEPAAPTPVWAFNAAVPGPLLRVRKGGELRLRLVNALAQPLALHWQGVALPNALDGADGLAGPALAPGGMRDIRFTPPDAGLFWYRASAWPFAAEQKGRGLYGVLIVDELEPPAIDHDVVLVLDDWRLDEKGAITPDFLSPADCAGEGRVGALPSVNSKPLPEAMTFAPGARVRLRLLNACNARMAGIIFENTTPFVIGIDGQACEAFTPIRNTIPIGPGARFDLLFDIPVEAGQDTRVMLRGGGLRSDKGGEEDRALLILRAAGAARPGRPAIAGAALNPRLPAEIKLQNAKRLDLTIEAGGSKDPRQAWIINGAAGSPQAKSLFSVAQGQPVSLGFLNRTSVAQTLHIHGHHMRVLHLLDDGWEPYWRDAVIIPPGRTARVAFLADNPGKWLIESTILEHAMSGVSAWFEVK